MVFIDGHYYSNKSDAPNLGSLVGSAQVVGKEGLRHYDGSADDADKLPVYSDLTAGSDATLVSTTDGLKYYVFDGTQWIEA